MSNVIFTRDIQTAIITIAHELKRMNDLKEKELKAEYGGHINLEEE